MRFLFVMALALTVSSAWASDPAAEAKPTIDKANSDWEGCIKTMDADCIVEAYADDAVFVLPDGKTIAGKAAIRDLYVARAKTGVTILAASIHSDAVVSAGADLVYEYGTGTMQAKTADGKEATRGGPYLTVWHRAADGSWQIIRNLVF